MQLNLQPALRVLAALALLTLPIGAEEHVDLGAVQKIREEATANSKVMDTMFYLTDVYGPRLTNSPGFFKAADWAAKRLTEWGIPAQLEKWGPYGRGWEYTHFEAELLEPTYAPLIGFPLAFTPGTDGPVSGEVMIAVITKTEDFAKYKGKLKGRIVMLGEGRNLTLSTDPLASRRNDQDLANLAMAPDPALPAAQQKAPGAAAVAAFTEPEANPGAAPVGPPEGRPNETPAQRFQKELNKFLADEGAAMVLRMGGGRSEGGTVFGQGSGSRDPKDPVPPPMVALTPEHYNRLARLLDAKIPVKVRVNVTARFLDDRTDSVNIIGEIAGGAKKDEVVMLGAHFDSWHGGTGATDNAAGSAVMMEAMRILKTLKLPMARTVRIGLWSGEEQGLLGSKAYVKEHFGDPETMQLTAAHSKFAGYFNVDNGSGKIRGVYLQGNDMMRPIFEQWLAPFRDQGVTTISIRNTGGTDHLSFDAVGLPGFQFIQDGLEYNTRTHHSNMDVYDRVQRADLIQMAEIVASLVYDAANREELLPRKPLPKPQPPRRQNGAAPATGATAAQ